MQFRTEIRPLDRQGLITHRSHTLLMGSCFTDHVGSRMSEELFPVTVNPFGAVYNPASIHQLISCSLKGRHISKSDLIYHEGRYHTFLCHTAMSRPDAEATLLAVNDTMDQVRQSLRMASTVILSYGTAWVYDLASTGQTVGNCHKQPSALFNRHMMDVDDAARHILDTCSEILELNPEARFIFTVSPIRHTADGLHGNQLSKSTLLLAIDRVCNTRPDRFTYFPAYEILMDDLRDYRFYAPDMKHPSDTAADYVYELFSTSFFNEHTRTVAQEARRFTRRLRHRSPDHASATNTDFRTNTYKSGAELAGKYPELQAPIKYHLSHLL